MVILEDFLLEGNTEGGLVEDMGFSSCIWETVEGVSWASAGLVGEYDSRGYAPGYCKRGCNGTLRSSYTDEGRRGGVTEYTWAMTCKTGSSAVLRGRRVG